MNVLDYNPQFILHLYCLPQRSTLLPDPLNKLTCFISVALVMAMRGWKPTEQLLQTRNGI